MIEWKKKGWLFKTVLILAAVLFAAVIVKLISMVIPGHDMFGHRNGFRMRDGGPGPFGGRMRHGGPLMDGMPGRQMGWFHGFFFLAVLVKIGVIMAGWLLWKTARGSGFRKWAGGLLAVAGICSLLPALIAIPLIALIGYLVYKASNKKPGVMASASLQPETPIIIHSNADILDQWENHVRGNASDAGTEPKKEDN